MSRGSALVTGGAGFIGSRMVDKLLEMGFHVSVLDNFSTGRLENIERHLGKKGFKLVKGPITDRNVVRRTLRGVDVVFHYAALLSVIQSIADPITADMSNTGGTLLLLDEARRADTERFVFASSAAVYGSSGNPPLREDSILNPDSPYGATKVAGEAYCNAFFHAYGLGTVILRYFNVYGPRCRTGQYGGVMAKFADRLARSLPVEVFGDGAQTRDFVFVGDAVRATMTAALSGSTKGETFNIGTGRATSISELANIFLRSNLAAGKVRVVHRKPRPGEIRHSVASIRKARRVLGYQPRTSISEGVRSFVNWYKETKDSVRM